MSVEKLLMRKRCWDLVSTNDGLVRRYNLNSYIVHKCPQADDRLQYWWSMDLINTVCYNCHEYPPDHVMGLWKLHNWEYVQNDGHRVE